MSHPKLTSWITNIRIIETLPFIQLSLVNLIIAVGISVSFCSPIVRAFSMSREKDRVERSRDALTQLGSSEFSGDMFLCSMKAFNHPFSARH